jgi:putative ABC transport system permease protein
VRADGGSRLDLGLDSDRILMVDIDVARTAIAPANRVGFFHQVVERIGALPGVAGAAASLVTPVGGGGIIDEVEVIGAAPVSEGESTFGLPRFWTVNSVMLNVVTPGWFETYGMTLRRGRSFADRDDSRAPRVAIVNEAFVRKFLHDRDPIGAAITHRIGRPKGLHYDTIDTGPKGLRYDTNQYGRPEGLHYDRVPNLKSEI